MSSFGIYFSNHDDYQILKYGKGQKFTNHIDDHPSYHRRVSSIYYINDDYEGGEINFPRFNISYKPKANEMIIFPSTYVYNHSVSEVLSGTRYAVVSWIK
jgi:predicted 2-oxoglutarate/Fe(II)-dependent dioxygenase YbiX